jgi:hypothetical protein
VPENQSNIDGPIELGRVDNSILRASFQSWVQLRLVQEQYTAQILDDHANYVRVASYTVGKPLGSVQRRRPRRGRPSR